MGLVWLKGGRERDKVCVLMISFLAGLLRIERVSMIKGDNRIWGWEWGVLDEWLHFPHYSQREWVEVFKSGCSPFSFSLPIENFGFLSQPKKTKKQNLKLNILGTTDYTLFHGSLGGLPRDYSEDYA